METEQTMGLEYDTIIIGGGPTGLTIATYAPGKIALIERQPVLGGCHRYDDSSGKFVEHGPRVYSGAYVNVSRVLRDIGTDWDTVFQKIDFSPEYIDNKRWYQWLSAREIAWLTFEYIVFLLFNADHGKIPLKTYCLRKGFSTSSIKYLDLVCRFSDGAGANRYTLWEFLNGFDQHIAPFYAPRKPLDALFAQWGRVLQRRGVDVLVNTNVTSLSGREVHNGYRVHIGSRVLRAKKVIVCVPPVHAARLLNNGPFTSLARKTKYEKYWSISFFGVTYGSSQKTTPWGIIAVQYPFGVVSAAATLFDVKSPVTGKTLSKTANKEAAKEIRRQLGFPDDTRYAYSTGPYQDQAFMMTQTGYIPWNFVDGVATVGCHNGHSSYKFTSMESAVQNALVYLGKTPEKAWFLGDYIRSGILLLLVYTFVRHR